MLPKTLENFEFLLFDGFSNMVLASAMEPLRDVKLRGYEIDLNWKTSTLDGQPVISSSGLTINPDCQFDASRPATRLVLVSGYHMRERATPMLRAGLRRAARECRSILALDTASWLLAYAGLLDGRRATIHWQERDALAESFPNVMVCSNPFVRSGPFYSCGAASTAMALVLDLIKELFGKAAAFDASAMFHTVQDGSQRVALQRQWASDPDGDYLIRALEVIADHVESPITTPDLAQLIGMSERTLNRVFSRCLNLSPGKYMSLFRLRHAQYLAQETALSLEQIALRCGYASASSLCRAYRIQFSTTLRHNKSSDSSEGVGPR